MSQYRTKIVAFIDILGFGEMIDSGQDASETYSIVSAIRTSIVDWANVPIASDIDLVITQFSDSIVFSFLPTSHYFMTFNFVKKLSIKMVHEGILLRGGITYGQIFHDEEFIFGPAMNRAYFLESKEHSSELKRHLLHIRMWITSSMSSPIRIKQHIITVYGR